MTNPLRRTGNAWLMPVIVVCVTLLVIVCVASYTYLESMGRITPQWMLWVLPTITSALSYLKSAQACAKAESTDDKMSGELQHSAHLANEALAALPPRTASQIVAKSSEPTGSTENPGGSTIGGR